MRNIIPSKVTQPQIGIGMNGFISNTMFHHYFFLRCSSEHLVTVSVHEPASEDDTISDLSQVGEGFVEHEHSTMNEIPENENTMGSISAPQRYLYEFDFICLPMLNLFNSLI
jgi:hypothetical protein